MLVVRRLWAGWKRVGRKIADVQSRALLTLVYFTLIAPFSLVVRWTADPLGIKRDTVKGWRVRAAEGTVNLDLARRQF